MTDHKAPRRRPPRIRLNTGAWSPLVDMIDVFPGHRGSSRHGELGALRRPTWHPLRDRGGRQVRADLAGINGVGRHPRLAALHLAAGRALSLALRLRGWPVLRGQRRCVQLDAARSERGRIQRLVREQPARQLMQRGHRHLQRPQRTARRTLQGNGRPHVLVGPRHRRRAVWRGAVPAHQGRAGARKLHRSPRRNHRPHARLDITRLPPLDALPRAAGVPASQRRHIGPLRRTPRQLLRLYPTDGLPRRTARRHWRQ